VADCSRDDFQPPGRSTTDLWVHVLQVFTLLSITFKTQKYHIFNQLDNVHYVLLLMIDDDDGGDDNSDDDNNALITIIIITTGSTIQFKLS